MFMSSSVQMYTGKATGENTMFKICMKNYFANLKYVFVALGVMYLALIIGAQTTVNKSIREVKQMVASIEETTESSELSLGRIGDSITGTFNAVKHNISPEVLSGEEQPVVVNETIGESIIGVISSYTAYFGQVVTYVAECVAGIIVAVILFAVIQILGVFAGTTLVTMFGRYDMHPDNIFRIILEQMARIVLLGIWVDIIILVCVLNLTAGIIMAALLPLAFCYIVLFSVWLTAGDDRRPQYSSYVTFVNMLLLLACNIVQILISLAIAAVVYLICGAIVAAVFGAAMLILAAANANLNAFALLYQRPELSPADTAALDAIAADSAETSGADASDAGTADIAKAAAAGGDVPAAGAGQQSTEGDVTGAESDNSAGGETATADPETAVASADETGAPAAAIAGVNAADTAAAETGLTDAGTAADQSGAEQAVSVQTASVQEVSVQTASVQAGSSQ